MSKIQQGFDLVLIGGGTASLAALQEALDLGVESVAIIDKGEELGGECALNACVPTKTMLTASRYLQLINHQFVHYGVEEIEYRFNFSQLMQTVEQVIHDGEYEFVKDKRVTVIKGEASFSGKESISVMTDNGVQEISAKKIIIATGSVPMVPKITGLEEVGYITFQKATHLEKLPESLVIIGGGPVGVEFAQMFQTFGVQVTLLQKQERLIDHEEPEISEAITKTLTQAGVRVICNVDIEQVKCSLKTDLNNTSESACPSKVLEFSIDGAEHTIEAEQILIAAGMKPNVESLKLSDGDIETTPKDAILVDETLQTTNPNVWAIGDVIGQYQFTHVADYHAVIAVRNAIRQEQKTVDYEGLGWAIFTEPTVSRVGMTEAEAKRQYPNAQSVTVPTSDVSRYRIENERGGFIKLIIDADSRQILGAHFFASHAEDIAHVVMLAIRQKLKIEQVLDLCYIYPAKAQLLQKALEKLMMAESSQKTAKKLTSVR